MNRLRVKNEPDGIEFLFIHNSEKFAWISDSNIHQSDSAWHEVSAQLIKEYELEEKWIAATRYFHIEELISADLTVKGEWLAKYDSNLDDPTLFNETSSIDRHKNQVVSLFIQLNDVTLSSLELDIKLDKGLRIITTFGMMNKSQIIMKPLDIAHPNQDLQPSETGVQNSDCFVATAVYQSPNHPNVIKLRAYRDQHLQKTFMGRIFIKIYYKLGPYLAKLTRKSKLIYRFFKLWVDKISTHL